MPLSVRQWAFPMGNGIGKPEAGTPEALLTAVPGPPRFILTYRGQGLPAPAIAALPVRPRGVKNPTWFALTPQSLTDFDWLVSWIRRDTPAAVRCCLDRMMTHGEASARPPH